jgi:hypothetical protein
LVRRQVFGTLESGIPSASATPADSPTIELFFPPHQT